MLQNDRVNFLHNPLIDYLNINSLRNKVIDLGEILKDLPLDYLVISETKLDESFPSSQLKRDGYLFSTWAFFHAHSRFTGQQGKGEGIYLTPLYHFHPLHRHLDIRLLQRAHLCT